MDAANRGSEAVEEQTIENCRSSIEQRGYSITLMDASAIPTPAQQRVLISTLLQSSTHGRIKDVEGIVTRYPPLLDAVDGAGFSALLLAVTNGHYDIVQLLLSHGANIELQTQHGNSVLHQLAHCHHVIMLETLMKHAVKLSLHIPILNSNNDSPLLHWCLNASNADCIQWYLENGGDKELFMMNNVSSKKSDALSVFDCINTLMCLLCLCVVYRTHSHPSLLVHYLILLSFPVS